jgi:hypothetical protein
VSVKTTQELATQVCFPSQQAIIEYFNSHPLKTMGSFDSAEVKSCAPDGIEKVAKCFADKTMPYGSIENDVKEALTDHEEEQKLADDFRLSMKQLHKNIQHLDPYFEIIVGMHLRVLQDLLGRVIYTPSKESENGWTRHVADLTKKETPSGQLNLDKDFV